MLSRRIWGLYTDLLILVAASTLHNTTKLFARSLQISLSNHKEFSTNDNLVRIRNGNDDDTDDKHVVIEMEAEFKWADIYAQFQFLKRLSRLINKIVASNVTFLVAVVSLYYAINIGQTLLNNGNTVDVHIILKSKMVRSIFYYVEYGMILLVAADVGRQVSFKISDATHNLFLPCLKLFSVQMDTLRDWLSVTDNRKQVPLDELCLTINELDKQVVAVKGSHVFPITYSLLANVTFIIFQKVDLHKTSVFCNLTIFVLHS